MPRSIVRRATEHLHADQPRSEAGRRLSEAILRLRRSEQLQAQRAVRDSGLLNIDLTALRYLVQADLDGEDLGPKDLIVLLETSSANVTNVVERLVRRGYLTRVQHPTDRRAHHLVPTPAAVQAVDDAFGVHHAAVVTAIDRLSAADADVAARVIIDIADALDVIESA